MARNRRPLASLVTLAFVISIFLWSSGSALAARTLSVSAERLELAAGDQTTVTVSARDESGQPPAADLKVNIRVSRGGVLETAILKDGLLLKNGVARFVYLAPGKPGAADVLVMDPSDNASARLSFQITEQRAQVNWKEEFAEITKVKGRSVIKAHGKQVWDAALAGTRVRERDTVMTWDKSWVTLRLFDGSELTLQPGTTLYVKSLKSSAENPSVKESVFKAVSGKVLAKAKEYLGKGSRFEIETESATAGVRGTFFELLTDPAGDAELIVFQGNVLFEQLRRELLFMVRQGERMRFRPGEEGIPDLESHNITPEQREQELADEQDAAGPDEGEAPVDEEPPAGQQPPNAPGFSGAPGPSAGQEPPAQQSSTGQGSPAGPGSPAGQGSPAGPGSPAGQEPAPGEESPTGQEPPGDEEPGAQAEDKYKTNIAFGSQRVGELTYLGLHLQPEFRKVFGSRLSFGLDIPFYQDPTTGEMHFSSPDETVRLGNLVNWMEYDGRSLYASYGPLAGITYGYGLLLGDYQKEQAKGVQLGLKTSAGGGVGGRILAPFDVVSFVPFKTAETSTLYAGRLTKEVKLMGLPLEAGLTYVTDTNETLRTPPALVMRHAVPTAGAAVDLGLQAKTIQPYVELAALENFGAGGEAGVRGKISRFRYKAAMLVMNERFAPNYFGATYEEDKANYLDPAIYSPVEARMLPDLNNTAAYPASAGYHFGLGADLGPLKADMSYENYSERTEAGPVLGAKVSATTPKLGPVEAIDFGADYRQVRAGASDSGNRWLNQNTTFSWYLTYPVRPGLYATITNKFIPSDFEISYRREVGIALKF